MKEDCEDKRSLQQDLGFELDGADRDAFGR